MKSESLPMDPNQSSLQHDMKMVIIPVCRAISVESYLTDQIDLLRRVHHKPTPGTLLNIHVFVLLKRQLQKKTTTRTNNQYSQNKASQTVPYSGFSLRIRPVLNLDLLFDRDPVYYMSLGVNIHPTLTVVLQLTGCPAVCQVKG